MRVLVTGAGGFVGRWLMRELADARHEAIAAPSSSELDMSSSSSVSRMGRLISSVEPDAVVHLAAMSYPPDAADAPERAIAVNGGGTEHLVTALLANGGRTSLLVTSSSEVYGSPDPGGLPLSERSELRGRSAYAASKLAQERAALKASGQIPMVVVRSFNHTGPGQRPTFVVPSLAERVDSVLRGEEQAVRVGNLDVRRDFSDVRDVVGAYRLLLEAMHGRGLGSDAATIFNVASGRSVAIRSILASLWQLAGLPGDPRIETDAGLARPGEPSEIRGDASALAAETGWRPRIPLERTLEDVLRAVAR
jgi:GDP-4-dehydro-6-deoxy-D-mannose reductase